MSARIGKSKFASLILGVFFVTDFKRIASQQSSRNEHDATLPSHGEYICVEVSVEPYAPFQDNTTPHAMRRHFDRYGGVFVGSLYGLIMRVFFSDEMNGHAFTDLFSVTFVWIVPIVVGVTPLMFASKVQLTRNVFRLGTPILTVILFFLCCFLSKLEDIVCLIIISVPWVVCAALGGFVFSGIILNHRRNKGILYSLFLIPFVSGLIEEQLPTPSQVYEVKTAIIVNSSADKVWANVVRVKRIDESEYDMGFFNYAGIPRPLYAELDKDSVGANRTGHFEGGLTFREKVISWDRNKRVSFDITVVPSSIRRTVFDQHILKGKHFAFLNASYSLRQIGENRTELVLTSSYQLDTKLNFYGAYWGDKLLTDFQTRLLEVIKNRCDE